MVDRNRRVRPALMTSVALVGMALGNSAAQAEDMRVSDSPWLSSTDQDRQTAEDVQTGRLLRDAVELAAHQQNITVFPVNADVALDPNILIALPGTPTTARDPVNITGVGQMITSFPQPDGSVSLGLCTGSLINPRTVLFAAHCVNDLPANAYGSGSGGVAIGFGFNAQNNVTQEGAPAGTSPLRNWLFGTEGRAPNTTNADEFFYTVNSIAYNPLSLEEASLGFLYGDVAIASLDTPASNIPQWSLLLSPLPVPGQIDENIGTGYRVGLAGYGGNGTGTSGTQAIDFRRRVAENYLGALTSLAAFEGFLFGGNSSADLLQNLYFIDFDDPARGTPGASPFDFNAFKDDGLPNEGTTAGGDSGGPLILSQAFSRELIIGVLSGGYTRFFNGQPSNGYGTVSFYQPLYLYWDWIAANNPYRYVGAAAGDGNWEDASHWISLQDPSYFILGPDGQPINGVPTQPGEENLGTDGKFGQACFFGECLDFATDTFVIDGVPVGAASDGKGTATFGPDGVAANQPATVQFDPAVATPQPQAAAAALPAPTIANGLPGATGFVPNNSDGNRLEGVLPRYFDVTLSNAGTTTLNSNVTIDRLTLRGTAGLNIASGAQLTSLIDINQFSGTMTVGGNLASVGDYTLFTGLLQGTGTITAPFVNSVAGTIAPGTVGTTGTLSIDGNLVLASATQILFDISGSNSDLIAVNGLANLGGTVRVGTGIGQQVNGLGRRYTVLTASEGISGTFATQNISAILSQAFTYSETAVQMEIRAASYGSVIDGNDPVQRGYAQLFDQNRSNSALSGLYALDFASVDTIRSTFTGLAPVNEQAVRSLSGQTINLLQGFNDARLREADRSKAGGKIAVTGAPLNVLQAGLSPIGQPLGAEVMALQGGAEDTTMTEANLPEDLAIYLAGGVINGDVDSLPGFTQDTSVSGFYISGGLEFYPGDKTMVGLSGYYNSLEADTPLDQRVDSETYAASLYMRHQLDSGLVIDGQFSMGSMGFDTQRRVQFLGAAQQLNSSSDDLLISGALGISYDLETGIGTFSPGVEARYASVDLSTVREDGGTLGLVVDRENFKSNQARFGFDYEKQAEIVQINATAQMVWEFTDGPQLLGANFAQGTGPNANFVLDTADPAWVELGVSANIGNGPFQWGVGFDTTIGRDNANARVWRTSATYRF